MTFFNNQNRIKSHFRQKDLIKGYKLAKTSTINICALARNCKKSLERNKHNIEKLCSFFKNYKIILFENDSIDGTREYIEMWSKQNTNVILIKCPNNPTCKLKTKTGYNYGQFSDMRIKKMSEYRDLYLDYIKKSNYTYTMVVDIDLDMSTIEIDGLMFILSKSYLWNGVFINGRSNVPGTFGLITLPYDAMAYSKSIKCKNPYNSFQRLYYLLHNYINLYIDTSSRDEFIKVSSAFNGVAIYKTSKLKNATYKTNIATPCEHCTLHENMDKLYISNKWINYQPRQGDGSIFKQLLNIFT
jgi:hypothetical protein